MHHFTERFKWISYSFDDNNKCNNFTCKKCLMLFFEIGEYFYFNMCIIDAYNLLVPIFGDVHSRHNREQNEIMCFMWLAWKYVASIFSLNYYLFFVEMKSVLLEFQNAWNLVFRYCINPFRIKIHTTKSSKNENQNKSLRKW